MTVLCKFVKFGVRSDQLQVYYGLQAISPYLMTENMLVSFISLLPGNVQQGHCKVLVSSQIPARSQWPWVGIITLGNEP